MRKILVLFIMIAAVAGFAEAAEITYTGRAGGGDLRAAQRSSLYGALLGGVKRYVQVNAPNRRGEVTSDDLMFINSFEILSRTMSGGGVNTTVRIDIDDMVLDDVSAAMKADSNSAVFHISGLPSYVNVNSNRSGLRAVFDKHQFSTNDQVAFEQEVVDPNRRQDVLTAFEAIGAQYLFDMRFNVNNAGGSCTVISEVTYTKSDNVSNVRPVLNTETVLQNPDSAQCVTAAVSAAVDNTLAHMRNTLVPAPAAKVEDYTYNLHFSNIQDLRSINELMVTLQQRRLVNRSEQKEWTGEETTFEVDSYLLPDELAYRIATLQFSGVESIEVDENAAAPESAQINFTMGVVAIVEEPAEQSGDGDD
ncbi:MAG: hypothetical protein LBV04_00660 [Deferribacteraceae bacterium]|jgi:hypothetical protein|nr:hypothetical protein [Deferribacteraceae bacterium]